jgi:hypothetical protein
VETRDTIRRSRRIMFVACGTSYHAALAARQTVGTVPALCLAFGSFGSVRNKVPALFLFCCVCSSPLAGCVTLSVHNLA